MLPQDGIVIGVTPARRGHSGRLRAGHSPVLCVGGGLVGLTDVDTRADE